MKTVYSLSDVICPNCKRIRYYEFGMEYPAVEEKMLEMDHKFKCLNCNHEILKSDLENLTLHTRTKSLEKEVENLRMLAPIVVYGKDTPKSTPWYLEGSAMFSWVTILLGTLTLALIALCLHG